MRNVRNGDFCRATPSAGTCRKTAYSYTAVDRLYGMSHNTPAIAA